MTRADKIWEVWAGNRLVYPASMGMTEAEAREKAAEESRGRPIYMIARPAEPGVVSTGDRRLLCTVCGARAVGGERRFRERHPRLCKEKLEFARQLSRGTRCVEDEEE